jgi:hypothetical protein
MSSGDTNDLKDIITGIADILESFVRRLREAESWVAKERSTANALFQMVMRDLGSLLEESKRACAVDRS